MENENKDPMQLLGELAKNPEMLRSMMSALSAMSAPPAENTPPASVKEASLSPAQTSTAPMPDISAMLSDPQTLAKISGIMSMLKSSGMGAPNLPAAVPTAATAPAANTASPDKSAALLLALKPYLSSDRQTAIENLIKFSKFGEILKNM